MVIFVSHRQVDDGQHHEDECLQGDDQDVEHSPRPLQHDAQTAEPQQAGAEHHGNQDEHQLAGVHVAEQTQCQGDRLGDQGHEFQQEVDRDQQDLNEDVLAAERVQGQFADEAADALDFDAVEDDQREYRQGHAQGSVRIGRRYERGPKKSARAPLYETILFYRFKLKNLTNTT